MKNIVLNTNMGDAILNRLKDFTELPASGYVAGQAVASAVSELFGDGHAVQYNDVDVFRQFTESDSVLKRDIFATTEAKSRTAIHRCTFTTMERERSQYEDISETTVERYKVVGTRRNGMLNEVLCEFAQHNHAGFLETFDLNCVQVGVDLATKQLFWTPQFEQFTKTRQLDVVTLHTPFHSLIRYFRKKEELAGVYGNDERIIEMLAAAYFIEVNRAGDRNSDATLEEYSNLRWRFGRIYREKLQAVENMILPHFTVETEMVHDYPVSILVPRFTPGQDLTPKSMPNLVHCLPKLSRALREKHTKGTQAKFNHLAKTFDERSVTRQFWLTKNDDFIKGNVTPAQIGEMDRAADRHFICHHFDQPTLGLQWQQYSYIRTAALCRGAWVYGVMANSKPETWADETLAVHLDHQAAVLSKQLVRKTLPDLTIGRYRARELVKGLELIQDGAEIGYGAFSCIDSVKGRTARVISLRASDKADTWLTFELRKQNWAWTAGIVSRVQYRESLPYEKLAMATYANYSNLAMFAGSFLTGQFVQFSPEKASAAGAKIGQALRQISATVNRRFGNNPVGNYSARLAATLPSNLRWGVYGKDKRQYHTPHRSPFAFWAIVAPVLLSQRFAGNSVSGRSSTAGPNFADMDDDIPF